LSKKALLPKPEGYVEPEPRPRGNRPNNRDRNDRRGGNDKGRRNRD